MPGLAETNEQFSNGTSTTLSANGFWSKNRNDVSYNQLQKEHQSLPISGYSILLDGSLNVKISGYSIPLPSKKGLNSTLDKQVESTNNAEKEDVYHLGVILLELITGKLITSSPELQELKDEL